MAPAARARQDGGGEAARGGHRVGPGGEAVEEPQGLQSVLRAARAQLHLSRVQDTAGHAVLRPHAGHVEHCS